MNRYESSIQIHLDELKSLISNIRNDLIAAQAVHLWDSLDLVIKELENESKVLSRRAAICHSIDRFLSNENTIVIDLERFPIIMESSRALENTREHIDPELHFEISGALYRVWREFSRLASALMMRSILFTTKQYHRRATSAKCGWIVRSDVLFVLFRVSAEFSR